MRTIVKRGAVAALSLAVMASAAFAENVKIAFIDPLSGPFASTGTNGLHQYEFAAEALVNANGGVLGGQKFEIVGFDNKISPKESLIQLQVAIDQGIRALGPSGTAVLIGMAPTDTVHVPVGAIQGKEIWLTGTFRYANTYPSAIELITSGKVDLDALVSASYTLDEVEQALTHATKHPADMKVMVHPSSAH